jgi:signal transducing adaptor molecule
LTEQASPTRSAPLVSGPVTRVRALHNFEPTVAGELPFEKGDIIKVTDRAYDNWWRGQLRGRTGIFPVNYVVRNVYPTLFNV